MADVVSMADSAALERAAAIVRAGGIVAVPTETFYGLAADASNAAARARIYEIKGRPGTMALPLVAASVEQVAALVGPLDPRSARAAARFWPGPLSLVLPASADWARGIGGETVAVRVPGHAFVQRLCDRAAVLLTSTSANRTGEPPAETAEAVAVSLGGAVDLIVDGGRTPGGKPSTLADLRGAEPRLIRDGAIPWPLDGV